MIRRWNVFCKLRCVVSVAALGGPSQLPSRRAAPPFTSLQPFQDHAMWRRQAEVERPNSAATKVRKEFIEIRYVRKRHWNDDRLSKPERETNRSDAYPPPEHEVLKVVRSLPERQQQSQARENHATGFRIEYGAIR
jgi:hypothetical protein